MLIVETIKKPRVRFFCFGNLFCSCTLRTHSCFFLLKGKPECYTLRLCLCVCARVWEVFIFIISFIGKVKINNVLNEIFF